MSAKDALSVHARAELGIDPESVTNPWAAAFASFFAFTLGGLVPIVPVLLASPKIAVWIAGGAVIAALGLTGFMAATLGRIPAVPAIARTVLGGMIAMGATYGVGALAGTQL